MTILGVLDDHLTDEAVFGLYLRYAKGPETSYHGRARKILERGGWVRQTNGCWLHPGVHSPSQFSLWVAAGIARMWIRNGWMPDERAVRPVGGAQP